jgi:ribonuclease HI
MGELMSPEEKLEEIYNLISDEAASGRDMLLSTQRLLDKILNLVTGQDMIVDSKTSWDKDTTIFISCDASIKVNPGGPAAIGAVIRIPGEEVLKVGKFTPATTNNEAEYDAIYEGLTALVNLHNKPKFPIVVRSDSQLVVKQLMGEYKLSDERMKRKYESIHELASSIKIPIAIEWCPRNSTPDLTEANFLAQDMLGVKRH